MAVTLRGVREAYENDDFLIGASRAVKNNEERNLAVSPSTYTSFLSLEDAVISYNEREISIPGKSFVTPFREITRSVIETRALNVEKIDGSAENFVIRLLLEGLHGKRDLNSVLNHIFLTQEGLDGLRLWRKKGNVGRIKEYIELYRERINKGIVDNDGVVCLSDSISLNLQKEYYDIGDKRRCHDSLLGRLKLPLKINAEEAEFSFHGGEGIKVADGDERVGINPEGIFKLKNADIWINREVEKRKYEMGGLHEVENIYFFDYRRAIKRGVMIGSLAGGVASPIFYSVSSMINNHGFIDNLGGAVKIAFATTFISAVLGVAHSVMDVDNVKKYTFDATGRDMDIALFGTLD